MIMNLYSVYDEKTECFFPPIFCHTDGQAVRHFMTVFRKPESQFNQFAKDFKIYNIGKFNDSDGAINGLAIPALVINGQDLLEKEEYPLLEKKQS